MISHRQVQEFGLRHWAPPAGSPMEVTVVDEEEEGSWRGRRTDPQSFPPPRLLLLLLLDVFDAGAESDTLHLNLQRDKQRSAQKREEG